MTEPGQGEPGRRPRLVARRRAAESAEEALVRTLYAEHGRALLGYVTRVIGDRHQAEDIVQETLVRAWHHAGSLTPERGSVRGWLLRVARNIIIDRHRARQARPTEVEESATEPADDRNESDQVLDTLHMLDALGNLRPEHRAVLVEVYYRGLTLVEAADVLGVPVGTVKSRIYYALRALRLAFEEGRSQAG
jgi:RNA polymerase sigma-70 factor (ECF subfamily)